MPELFQHVIVTLVAFWAAWVVVRRVMGLVKPGDGPASSCDHCPTGQSRERTTSLDDGEARPLTLVRERRR